MIVIWPARCSGLLEWMCPGLMGLPAELLSSSRLWSARHNSSSSRRENSSPGSSCLLHTEHRKHSMWYTLSLALITKSLLLNPRLHFAHFIPNSLQNWTLLKVCKNGREVKEITQKKPFGQISRSRFGFIWFHNKIEPRVCLSFLRKKKI